MCHLFHWDISNSRTRRKGGGRKVGLTPVDDGPLELQRVERYFEKYGSVTVFFGRLLPGVRTFIAVPAGLARMPQVKFQVYTFLGSWPWCFGLALVGEQLGEHWNKDPWLQSILHEVDLLIAAGLVLWAIWWFWRRKIS